MNVANLIQIVAGLSWLIFVGMLFIAGISASRGRPIRNAITLIIGLGVLSIILSTIGAGLVFVKPEERGMVISALDPKGYRDQALTPGLRWIVPYFESVKYYNISRQTYTMSIASREGQVEGDDSISARTSDGQEVFVDASVIFSIDPDRVPQVHIEWQDRYSTDLVRPLARGVIRDTISQYRVDQVYSTKRNEVAEKIRELMAEKMQKNGLLLHDFLLRNITFSPEYAASVEQKQIAEQRAQQAKFIVEQKRQEAEQARQIAQGKADAAVIEAEGQAKSRLIQAKAEADSLKLIGEAIKSQPELITYQYVTNLAPGVQVMLVPNDNPFLLPLPSLIKPTPTKEGTNDTSVQPTPAQPEIQEISPTPTITP